MILNCSTCQSKFARCGKTGPIPKYCGSCKKLRHIKALGRFHKSHKEQRNQESRLYHQRNKERERLRNAEYRRKNKERLLEAGRINKRTNRPRFSVYEHKRRAFLYKATGQYTELEFATMCKFFQYRCVCCHKRKKLTVDHVVPLSKGGSNFIRNIQPLCKSCNSSKSDLHSTDYRKSFMQKFNVDVSDNAEVYFGNALD